MLLRLCIFAAFLALISTLGGNQSFASPGNRVTILYDAFGEPSALTKDWGFAALVEYHGKRILFDTGNNAEVFAHNVAAAGVDLGNLDFAVISHRHLDHAAGLPHLLAVNPGVKIYVPKEAFGNFGSSLPAEFYRKEEMLPESMRYFDGRHQGTKRTVAGNRHPGRADPDRWLLASGHRKNPRSSDSNRWPHPHRLRRVAPAGGA